MGYSPDPAAPAPDPHGPARGFVVLLGLAAGVVTLAGLHAVASIVGPAFLALTLAIAVSPVRAWLERHRMPAVVCVLAPVLLVIVLLLLVVGALAVSVARLATLLPTYADRFHTLVATAGRDLHKLGVDPAQVKHALHAVDPAKIAGVIGGLVSGVAGVTSAIVLIVVLVFAMTADATVLSRRISGIAAGRPHLVRSLHTFTRQTSKYLRVTTVFGVIVAVLDTGALLVLSVPLPLLWGLLALITNYIPNIGFIIGLIPPVLLALLDSGPGTAIAVLACYIVFNFVVQSLIQPKFIGEAAGLSITLTLLSLIVWTWVLGPIGAVLAIPLTSFARALLLDSDRSTHWASELLGAAPRRPKRARTEPDADPPADA
ncbi:MAG TPA: AI-2E family transporter [Streptosporangiaceae bacterium]|jgi:predicted PurR-regulated permease PerM